MDGIKDIKEISDLPRHWTKCHLRPIGSQQIHLRVKLCT